MTEKYKFNDIIAETLLIPLYMRAKESRRGKKAIIRDDMAESLVKKFDCDYSQFDKAKLSEVGCVVRGWYFDNAVRQFISTHTDVVVVNIGCGLDTRCQRIGGNTIFYELDLPEVMELRKKLIPETKTDRHITASLLDEEWMDKLKETCREPLYVGEVQGDGVQGKLALRNLHFVHDRSGLLKVWMLPQKLKHKITNRYLVIVDVGGRGRDADYSDILVIDRYWMMFGGSPEIVAEWHGHIDHDLLAWKAAQIAAFYDNAKLVIESNTIETKDNDTDGDQSELIFNRIAGVYDNLYVRRASEAKIAQGITTEYGYHTNRKTKPMIISNLVACVRDQSYIERNIDAIGEYAVYEKKENGSFGAADGYHDDRVMTRAIGLHICFNEMDLPAIVKPKPKQKKKTVITEATI